MKAIIGMIVGVCLLCPAVARAQSPVGQGTIEVAGSTGLALSVQTLTPSNAEDAEVDDDADLSVKTGSGTAGLIFYPSGRFGVGFATQFTRYSSTLGDSDITLSTALVGPIVKVRFDGERAGFALNGGLGIARFSLDSTGGGGGGLLGDGALKQNSFFWQAGAEADFFLNSFSAFTAGVAYQMAKITDPHDDSFELDSSGLSVAVGFSLYFGR